MVCESWEAKLDTYLDGELAEQEMRTFDAHVRGCPSCSAGALTRVQMKRAIHIAGKGFTPGIDFRRRIEQRITPKLKVRFGPEWMFAAAAAVIVVVGALT